jgi:hypothetical protein
MAVDEGTSSVLYNGKASGLVEFLDYVSAKGILSGSTAHAYKSACSRVLSIDGENWRGMNVRGLDIDLQMERYIRLHGASAKPASLTTYQQRVRAAIELYLLFLDNPAGFRGPGAKRRTSTSGPVAKTTPRVAKDEMTATPEVRIPAPAPPAEAATTLVTYPFPLRSGGMAYFQLPRDLPRGEVRRMSGFLESLAIDALDEASTVDAE